MPGTTRQPDPIRLSVIVPALDAAAELPACLEALARPDGGVVHEVIVVDGGSADDTVACAEAAGARVIRAPRGRGTQLAAGAAAASGDWLLFLHADTVLDPGWHVAAAGFMATPGAGSRAACFRFALDDRGSAARLVERGVALRCRLTGLCYGDQGLLISRGFYAALGGFRPLPLMEDVELVRRVGRRRLTLLTSRAITSARRYRSAGYAPRIARNLSCLALYYMGVPPAVIARLYG